eukprot:gene907-210_t
MASTVKKQETQSPEKLSTFLRPTKSAKKPSTQLVNKNGRGHKKKAISQLLTVRKKAEETSTTREREAFLFVLPKAGLGLPFLAWPRSTLFKEKNPMQD